MSEAVYVIGVVSTLVPNTQVPVWRVVPVTATVTGPVTAGVGDAGLPLDDPQPLSRTRAAKHVARARSSAPPEHG